MQVMLMWATLVYPALSLLVSQTSANCQNWKQQGKTLATYRQWVPWTVAGESCQDYSSQGKQYCTAQGKTGPGWSSYYWGAISSYTAAGWDGSSWHTASALQACCACGGGSTPAPSPFPTPFPTPSPTKSPTSFPTTSPTSSPTSSPTTSPTSSPITPGVPPAAGNSASTPAASTAVSATGDPHMQNMLGQRYDLTQPGRHTLLQIPRVASDSDDLLLRVMADAEHEGSACADMYFKALNITGEWASAHQKDGYLYAADAPQMFASWRTFGKVEMKVVWGRSLEDVEYLNLFVRHLKRVGHDIGGLLGMDDYRQAAKVNALCDSTTLLTSINDETRPSREASFAMADQ